MDKLCRNVDEGPDRDSVAIDVPRACPCDLVFRALVPDVAVGGRCCVEEVPLMDGRILLNPGVVTGFGTLAEPSDIGGEGGVGVSERPDDEGAFVGGVSKVGDDAVVVVGDSSDRGDAEIPMGCSVIAFSLRAKASVALRSFSLIISVSILRSDSSSRSLCASIRRLSRSCSPVRISSSSRTLLSRAWLYLDSMSSKDDSVLRCFLS